MATTVPAQTLSRLLRFDFHQNISTNSMLHWLMKAQLYGGTGILSEYMHTYNRAIA